MKTRTRLSITATITVIVSALACALLFGCGGSKSGKPTTGTSGQDKGAATLAPGEVKSCEDACERVAQCWQRQYGQDDTGTERRDCESRCMTRTAAEQETYFQAMATETSCVKLLDM